MHWWAGVRLQFGSPLNALHVILNRNETESGERKTVESIETDASTVPASESVSDDTPETVATGISNNVLSLLVAVVFYL